MDILGNGKFECSTTIKNGCTNYVNNYAIFLVAFTYLEEDYCSKQLANHLLMGHVFNTNSQIELSLIKVYSQFRVKIFYEEFKEMQTKFVN